METKQNTDKVPGELSAEALNEAVGGGASSPSISEIVVTKKMDVASPGLFLDATAPGTKSKAVSGIS